eukprot:8528285-Karenia_brevis.AAC.1
MAKRNRTSVQGTHPFTGDIVRVSVPRKKCKLASKQLQDAAAHSATKKSVAVAITNCLKSEEDEGCRAERSTLPKEDAAHHEKLESTLAEQISAHCQQRMQLQMELCVVESGLAELLCEQARQMKEDFATEQFDSSKAHSEEHGVSRRGFHITCVMQMLAVVFARVGTRADHTGLTLARTNLSSPPQCLSFLAAPELIQYDFRSKVFTWCHLGNIILPFSRAVEASGCHSLTAGGVHTDA